MHSEKYNTLSSDTLGYTGDVPVCILMNLVHFKSLHTYCITFVVKILFNKVVHWYTLYVPT